MRRNDVYTLPLSLAPYPRRREIVLLHAGYFVSEAVTFGTWLTEEAVYLCAVAKQAKRSLGE